MPMNPNVLKPPLMDPFQRTFPYLRLSITDACNFRCQYCLPNGYQKTPMAFLNPLEIERLVRSFVELGTIKVRLTGGEPTLRHDLPEIAKRLKSIPELTTLAMTTNGYCLLTKAKAFYDAGISSLNVSVDSLDRHKFHAITGHDKLKTVLKGIEFARKCGIETIKINTVLLKGFNDKPSDLTEFLNWIKSEALSIRFIELMETGDNHDYFINNHVPISVVKTPLLDHGFSMNERKFDAGPAVEFSHSEYQGKIGLIAPYEKDFCRTCNRLRVTARGDLRLCLFGTLGYPLRHFLMNDEQKPLLQARLRHLLLNKKETHTLHLGQTGLTPHLASLGG